MLHKYQEPMATFNVLFDELDNLLASVGVACGVYEKETEVSRVGKHFNRIHQAMSEQLSETPDMYVKFREVYRQRFQTILSEAAIVERNVSRPRGHHGDYETMQMMYRNGWEGSTKRGKLLHRALVAGRECESVRLRCIYLRDQVAKALCSMQEKVHILSLASGPATELREIDFDDSGPAVEIFLLDQDEEALECATSSLPKWSNLKVESVVATIAEFAAGRVASLNECKFDYIYSAGLFDYLNNTVASSVLRQCRSIIAPDGLIEVGNFSVWPAAFFVDMVCGWRLRLRNQVAFERLVPAETTARFIDVGDQLFCQMYPVLRQSSM